MSWRKGELQPERFEQGMRTLIEDIAGLGDKQKVDGQTQLSTRYGHQNLDKDSVGDLRA